jgi:DNA replication protein DnaC
MITRREEVDGLSRQEKRIQTRTFSADEIGKPVAYCDCGHELRYFMRPRFERQEDGTMIRVDRATLCPCDCVLEQRRREREQKDAEERQKYIDSIIQNGGLDPRFADASLDALSVPTVVLDAARTCCEAVLAGKKDSGLILLGNVGDGKTTTAAAMCKWLAARFRTFQFCNVPALLDAMRNTNDDESKARLSNIMYGLTECDLLVLDDLGAEKMTEWAEERLYLVVNQRYGRQKNIVVTSNAVKMARPAGDNTKALYFRELVSERIYDRLIQMCRWVENPAGSFRRKEAAGRQ